MGSFGQQVLAGITTMANAIMKLLTSLVGIFSTTIVPTDVNRPEVTRLKVGGKINFHEYGVVRWSGFFLQGENKNDQTSGFFSAAVSQKSYKRIDYFQYAPGNQKTDWQNFLPWSVKLGLNNNFTTQQNVYFNIGHQTRANNFQQFFHELKERYQQRM